MPSHRALATLALGAVLATACSSATAVEVGRTAAVPPANPTPTISPAPPGSASTAPSPPRTTAAPPQLTWTDCGDHLQCATLAVPLDYADPVKGTIQLALERRPASNPSQRIGSLLVNPGGPGIAGTVIPEHANGYLSKSLLQRFDVVGWDPRGTGRSTHVDCVDDLDPYLTLDPTPDTTAEKQALIDAAKDLAQQCEARSGRLLPFVSTRDSARDIDQIRRALGEDKISYFGFSYGSELGATFATLFPGSVRAMVLDGAIDPNGDGLDEDRRQVAASEQALNAFLAACASDRKCPFHNDGDPGAAFDSLLARLDEEPLQQDGLEVGQGVAYTAVVSALYDQSLWPDLADSLEQAQRGDGRGLANLFEAYVRRTEQGTYDNTFEALIAINCLDDPGPTDLAFADRFASELEQLAPRLGRASAYGYYCSFWPVPPVNRVHVTGAGAGPIIVVGTTGDPITPLESTRRLAEELEQGVLVTVEANDHTGYSRNACSVRTVDRYLLQLQVPAAGLVCR